MKLTVIEADGDQRRAVGLHLAGLGSMSQQEIAFGEASVTRSLFEITVALFAVVLTSVATAQGPLSVASPEKDHSATAAPEKIVFNRDIRPLLSDRCFHCHGPDRTSKEAEETDLRLDGRESVVDEYEAIVPGDAKASELLARLVSDDPDTRMPPAGAGRRPLTADEIEFFRRWIN